VIYFIGGPKTTTRDGWMGAVKFLSKLFDHFLKFTVKHTKQPTWCPRLKWVGGCSLRTHGTPQNQRKRWNWKRSSIDQEANNKIQRLGPPTGHVWCAYRTCSRSLQRTRTKLRPAAPTGHVLCAYQTCRTCPGHVRVAQNNTELLREKNQKAYQMVSE
jgi:hypothetical protein